MVHIVDLRSGEAYRTGEPDRRAVVDLGGARTVLLVPLLKNEFIIGFITIYRKEVHLLDKRSPPANLADQAVIAIKNCTAVQRSASAHAGTVGKTRALTATSQVLQVISASAGDLNPVFQKMLENATHICGASFGTMGLLDGDTYQNVALYNVPLLVR